MQSELRSPNIDCSEKIYNPVNNTLHEACFALCINEFHSFMILHFYKADTIFQESLFNIKK